MIPLQLRKPVSLAALALAGAVVALTTPCRAEGNGSPDETPPPQRRHVVRSDRGVSEPGSPTSYHGKPWAVDAAVGWQTANLTTFKSSLEAQSFTGGIIPTSLSGPSAQLGFSGRLYALTLGLRGSVAWLDASSTASTLELYSIDAELGLKLPFDRLELSLLFGGGYSVIGGLSDLARDVGSGLNVDGANARLALALDYYFSREFSVGARATAEVLFLARHGVALRDIPNQLTSLDAANSPALGGSGSSIGTALNISAGPAFHF